MNVTDKKNLPLEECINNPKEISSLIEYSSGSVVSKTIIDKKAGTITLFSFDAGQSLSEHQAPFDAVVQIIEGKALITIGGRQNKVSAGQMIIMPANISHSVKAAEKFKMLLIMIRE